MSKIRDRLVAAAFAHHPSLSALHWVAAVFVVLALAACALPPPVAPTRSADELRNWQARGRIAVSGMEAGGSGSFIWSQHGADAVVSMRGPVGIGNLELNLPSVGPIRMRSGDGQEWFADTALAELTARLGASLPTQYFRYWLVGLPAPGEHQWSAEGESAMLVQAQWRIHYQRFSVVRGVRLPTRLQAASGPIVVRMVVDRWTVQ